MGNKGQSLLELVIGVGLITVVVGAIAVVTVNTLRNTQFSKNQVQATKLAQENLEKVRTIKNSNFGVCVKSEAETGAACSTWEDIWTYNFGTVNGGCITNSTGCTFYLINNCAVNTGEVKPLCLVYRAGRAAINDRFSVQVIIEDEAVNQKRVTSKVFWADSNSEILTDGSGEHSSDLVTILTRI